MDIKWMCSPPRLLKVLPMLFLSKSRLLKKQQASHKETFANDHIISAPGSKVVSRSQFGMHNFALDTDAVSQKTTSSSTSFDEDNMDHDTLSSCMAVSTMSPSLCTSCDVGLQCSKKSNCPNFISNHFQNLSSNNLSLGLSKAQLVAYYVALDEYHHANALCEMRSAKLLRVQSEHAWLEKRRLNHSRLLSPLILEQMDAIQVRLSEAETELKEAIHKREVRAQALVSLGRF